MAENSVVKIVIGNFCTHACPVSFSMYLLHLWVLTELRAIVIVLSVALHKALGTDG